MYLNTLKPVAGTKTSRKRVGRGIGSGFGKTCGRGHKGQKARSGGKVQVGFEGGQMPLQRRVPKVGFSSRVGRVTDEIRLHELNLLDTDVIDVTVLQEANLIGKHIKHVKVMVSGTVDKAVNLKGLRVSKGARAAIEAAGGKVEE